MTKLHLGAGKFPRGGWVNVDAVGHPGIDLVFDLESCATNRLPFPDDSVDEILGVHFLEHIAHPLPLMQELHRVAKPDATCTFIVPYGSSDDAWENPTHVRPYFVHSFGYFGQTFYWREDYGYRGDWNMEKIVLFVPRAGCSDPSSHARVMEDVMTHRNIVREMHAYLRCVKPIRPAVKTEQTLPIEIALL